MDNCDSVFFKHYLFRPLPEPSVAMPFGARSVGHYIVNPDMEELTKTGHFLQLFWCVDGEGQFVIKGRDYALAPGQVFFYLNGDRHERGLVSSRFEYHWLTLDGPLVNDVWRSFEIGQEPRFAGRCPVKLFRRLEVEISDTTPDGQRRAAATAYAILSQAVGTGMTERRNSLVIKQAIRLIDERLGDAGLDVSRLADAIGIHRSSLSRRFTQEMAMTISDYLISARLRKAMTLLAETRLPVADIAVECGFADPRYFARVIKKHLAVTPTEFRNNC